VYELLTERDGIPPTEAVQIVLNAAKFNGYEVTAEDFASV